ncbi:RNA demethylase ALKBH9B-like [Macadamia integrifolia]|uniref:RNA demethylase ALKBH9B-like n=1 Tax=Macadamia integrifolia TaxID=60698 RepID=UPI001C52CF06|nr:RNA demethylase ALKBH9B-like [Macadamia integrifolia]
MTKEGVSGKKMETSGDSASLLKAIQQLDRRKDLMELLTEGFCKPCRVLLQSRFKNLCIGKIDMLLSSNGNYSESLADFCSCGSSSLYSPRKRPTSYKKNHRLHEKSAQRSARTPEPIFSTRHRLSYSDFLLLDESKESLGDDFDDMSRVIRKDFEYIEMINGRPIDILSGLELHTIVFNEREQREIVDYVYELQRQGQEGRLRARTYSEPKKWMRGKGRVTIQFGCCYNYAEDKKGNPPGIMRDEEVDPIPSLFKSMIKRLVRWNVLPSTCVPNSCIVNIYDKGDCIPPHIDHHDFLRPFCTVSFLTQCNILFGSNLKIKGAGEFSGPVDIPLPAGSVLVLSGNGSDIAKHCVPSVPAKRISITFRKMDDRKLPFKFNPNPELQGIQPLFCSPWTKSSAQQIPLPNPIHQNKRVSSTAGSSFQLGEQDFHRLGGLNSSGRSRSNKRSLGEQDFPRLSGSNSSAKSRPNKRCFGEQDFPQLDGSNSSDRSRPKKRSFH